MTEAWASIPVGWTYVFTVALGLVAGSFANVLVARLPGGKSIVRPGSHCPHCRKPIRWHDNIPVVSYLLLAGRCRSCRKSISVRYPVIELLTALLFVAVRIRFGWSPWLLIRDFPFVTMLIAITFIDLEHRIIPDVLSLPGVALGVLTSWGVMNGGLVDSLIGAGLGFGIFYGFAWIYYRISGRSGLGGGDIKLIAMLGAFTGPAGVMTTILVSSVLGSVLGITWAMASRQRNVMKTAIPYGPFLVVGGLYAYLLGDLIWFRFTNPI